MRIQVYVIPRSSKNLVGWGDEGLRVHLTAPPVAGAANDALVALLAQRLGLPKRDVYIVRGTTGRHKIVEIIGMTAETIEQKIK